MTKPFNFEYDATTGIYIVAALREKAGAERAEAATYEKVALSPHARVPELDLMMSTQAMNRAKLLETAADEIHQTVHLQLVADFNEAFKGTGE